MWRAPRPLSDSAAQQRAVELLSQEAPAVDIGENRIVKAVKHIAPSVVNIDTISEQKGADDLGYATREVRGKGSGVILTPDGYIVTNRHVIEGADRVRVTFNDGRWVYARMVGSDPKTDLAVVRVDMTNLPAADFGDSDALEVGEWSIAIGNPLGLGSTTTVGVISALNRRNLRVDENRVLDGVIQTDAAVNRGNSGGALANISGQVVGINTAILSASPQGGSIGLGFAIPANTVRRVAREVIQFGKPLPRPTQMPYMGIRFGTVAPAMVKRMGLEPNRGVMIYEVLPQSPASEAGLLLEDIILAVDGMPIGDRNDMTEAVQKHKAGESVRLLILRPALGKQKDFVVQLQKVPPVVRANP
jgi:S1-C subfamily serine protease